MTREEAINVLTNLQNGHGVSYSEDYGLCFGHKWMQAYEMAIAALREQPRWISVEERLPEDWLRVQVYRSANRTMDTDFRTPSRKGGWCHYNDITHWMPLPEPPEVEV